MHRTAAAAALAGLLLVTGCGNGAGATTTTTPPGATVHIDYTLFKETHVTIKAGQAVTFRNDNPITHVIVEGTWTADPSTGLRTSQHDDRAFSLKLANPGQQASYTFRTPGTYEFFCTIHAAMNGSVTVT